MQQMGGLSVSFILYEFGVPVLNTIVLNQLLICKYTLTNQAVSNKFSSPDHHKELAATINISEYV